MSRAKGGDDDAEEKAKWTPMNVPLLVSVLLAGMAVTGGVVPSAMQSSDRPVLLRDLTTRPITIPEAVSRFSLNDTEHTGRLLEELYSDLRLLGGGHFGLVFLGRRNVDNATVAVKKYTGDHDDKQELQFARYAQDCPIDSDECALAPVRRVFTYLDDWYGDDEEAGAESDIVRGGLEMDFIDGVTGKEYSADNRRYSTTTAFRATVSELSRTLLPLLKTIQRMHDHGIVHGDIHSGNIIYDARRQRWSLLDYGKSGRLAHRAEALREEYGRLFFSVLRLFGYDDRMMRWRGSDENSSNRNVRFPVGTMENVWLKLLHLPPEARDNLTLKQLISALEKTDADVLLDVEPGLALRRLEEQQEAEDLKLQQQGESVVR